ncbi:hypothetical protein GC176_21265 [bacterium]|nr:hypothetical protein [bacterium]
MSKQYLREAIDAGLRVGSIDLKTVASPDLDRVVADIFPGGLLKLSGSSEQTIAEREGIRVIGSGVDGVLASTVVTADFFTDTDPVSLELTAEAVNGWTLRSAFDSVPAGVSEAMKIASSSKPKVRITSAAGKTTLTLDFELDLDAIGGPLATILKPDGKGLPSVALHGEIILAEQGSKVLSFELLGPKFRTIDLKLFEMVDTQIAIGASALNNAFDKKQTLLPYVSLMATIPLTIGGRRADVPVRADAFNLGQALRFTAEPEQLIDAGITEIAKALVNGVGIAAAMPDNLKLSDTVSLKRFFVEIDTKGGLSVSQVGLEIKTGRPLPIVRRDPPRKDIAIEQADALIIIFDPFGSRSVSVSIEGEIDLAGNGRLVVGALAPDFEAHGEIKDGSEVHLDVLLDDLVGRPTGMPSTTLRRLQFSLSQSNYEFLTVAEGEWAITPGLELHTLAVDARHQPGAGTIAVQGQLDIGGIDLWLAGEYETGVGMKMIGSAAQGHAIEVGHVIDNFAKRLGFTPALPAPLEGLELSKITGRFDTGARDLALSGVIAFPAGSSHVELAMSVALKRTGEKDYSALFTGQLTVGGLKFDVAFAKEPALTAFVAGYSDPNGKQINLGDVIAQLTDSKEVIDLGRRFSFTVRDAALAFDRRQKTGNRLLLAMDIDAGIDLSNLPLVGKLVPPDQSVRIALSPLIAIGTFTADESSAFSQLLPQGGARFPGQEIAQGLTLHTSMKIGDKQIELALPIGASKDTGELVETSGQSGGGAATAAAPGEPKWFSIQKKLGPVHFGRVGVRYQDGEVGVLIDGSFSAAGLTLTLDGLTAKLKLDDLKPPISLHPSFGLNGVGIDFSNDAIEIGGALVRKHVPAREGLEAFDEYDGSATVRAKSWSLAAIGSFAYVQNQPSLFVYAVLNTPLGGPSFFFVTGLALGFGYNRRFIAPPIEGVKEFPLIRVATSASAAEPGSDSTASQDELVNGLADAIRVAPGQYFAAVGVKFTSFKLVDSFALLAVSFGHEFRIDVLGISTAVIPTPEAGKSVPPVAEVQMAFEAVFAPSQGILSVRAQLTRASYLLSHDCHLTGGFAFVTWFDPNEHAGDFVLTVGGYHNHFKPPSHYPVVPRLGFTWRLNSHLMIKGEAFFALTPSAVMAGGMLEATWRDGSLEAWFRARADFLMSWKPYHYEASISVGVGVRYTYHFFGTHHISVNVGADLTIWGPDFAGTARVHLWIVTFTVHFGSRLPTPPVPLKWSEFEASFLPRPAEICSIASISGMIGSIKPGKAGGPQREVWKFNRKDLAIDAGSAIPLNAVTFGKGQRVTLDMLQVSGGGAVRQYLSEDDGATYKQPRGEKTITVGSIAVGSMGISSPSDVDTHLTVSVHEQGVDVTHRFKLTPVLKPAPAALWGKQLKPSLSSDRLIPNTVWGLRLEAKSPPRPGASAPIDRRNLQFAISAVDHAYHFEKPTTIRTVQKAGRDEVQASINQTEIANARAAILKEFGIANASDAVTARESLADVLLADPVVTAS